MTTIPFVIDNQQHTMSNVLNALLAHHQGHALDIATAYFNVSGWQLLRTGLEGLGDFRLLLGDKPEAGFDLGLKKDGCKGIEGLIGKSKLGVKLSNDGFVEQLRVRYEESLGNVLPLKKQLEKTDRLIDLVVYRLYGLTEEEIGVVEGRG